MADNEELSENGSADGEEQNEGDEGEYEQQVSMDETILQKDGQHKSRSQWELIKQPLFNQIKFSGNVLWCEAAKARAKAFKPPKLFERVQQTSRMANLGTLSNIPKANVEYNKRICIIQGDICALSVDALVVPIDNSELCARVHALAGQELDTALKRQTISLGDAGLTQAFNLSREGLPQLLFHCNVPLQEDAVTLKQAYDRAFYMADLEGVTTMAVPVLSGVSYPIPGQDYYPLIAAVHVLLGCVRQQFEKSKNSHFVLLAIVCATDREKQVINELMELYFPHDAENEIPDDLDEKVEVVEVKDKKKKKGKSGKKKSGKKKK